MSLFELIRTGRLDLVPADLEMLESDLSNREVLAKKLDAFIPELWPPDMLSAEVLREFIRMRKSGEDPLFTFWYWILTEPGIKRVLIGSGGISSLPVKKDGVILGYSVLQEYCGRGYATEAVQGIIPVVFSLPEIRRILATTFPDLLASIRVLEKTGFVCCGEKHDGSAMEEGSLLYELDREKWRDITKNTINYPAR